MHTVIQSRSRPSIWSAAAESFIEICKVKARLHAVLQITSAQQHAPIHFILPHLKLNRTGGSTRDGFTHRPWPRTPRFWGPRAIPPYDDSLLTKNLWNCVTSQFTLKGTKIQMSTQDPCEYSSNTTILCIWTWERCRPSLWKWLQKNNEKEKRYLIDCQFSTDKKLATGQDRQRKAIFSVLDVTFGCFC